MALVDRQSPNPQPIHRHRKTHSCTCQPRSDLILSPSESRSCPHIAPLKNKEGLCFTFNFPLILCGIWTSNWIINLRKWNATTWKQYSFLYVLYVLWFPCSIFFTYRRYFQFRGIFQVQFHPYSNHHLSCSSCQCCKNLPIGRPCPLILRHQCSICPPRSKKVCLRLDLLLPTKFTFSLPSVKYETSTITASKDEIKGNQGRCAAAALYTTRTDMALCCV